METQGEADFRKYAPDLCEDKGMRWISRNFPSFVAPGAADPVRAGLRPARLLADRRALELVWGGLVRIFLIHHVTWSINSVCHFFGARRFDIEDQSTNVAWLAIPTFGESWHHNHHAFPRSARQAWGASRSISRRCSSGRWRRSASRKNVVRITPERQREKLVGAKAAKSTAAA